MIAEYNDIRHNFESVRPDYLKTIDLIFFLSMLASFLLRPALASEQQAECPDCKDTESQT